MVVRKFLKSTVRLLPFSDRIPSPIMNLLDEEKRSKARQIGLQTPQTTAEVTEPPVATWENKKHAVWVKKGALDEIDDAELWFQPPTTEEIPPISDEEEDESSYYIPEQRTFAHSRGSSSSTKVSELELPFEQRSFQELELERRQKDLRLKEYLNEQNLKFDALINNNIEAVIKKQSKAKPKPNLVKQIIGSVVSEGVNVVANHVPFRLPFVAEPLSSPSTPTLSDSEDGEDEEFSVELFIDTLNHKTKVRLLHELKRDMSRNEDTRKQMKSILKDDSKVDPRDSLDKVQLFMIISIKLFVIGLRILVPMTQYVYRKYQRNELYLFNSKNTQSLFDLTLKLMEGLEQKLDDHEDVINRVGTIGDSTAGSGNQFEEVVPGDELQNKEFSKHLDSLYDEYSMKASNLINEQLANKFLGESKPSWKRSIMEYVLSKGGAVEPESYGTDPKFSKYYSSQHIERIRTKASPTPPSVSSMSSSMPESYRSSRAPSTDNLPVKILRAAEKFVDEF